MGKVLSLLKEPSTYAGFSALALTFGVTNDEYLAYSTALATLFGIIAVAVSEKK